MLCLSSRLEVLPPTKEQVDMMHAELISQQNSVTVEKSATIPVDRGDNPSLSPVGNLAVRLRMADELVERGLSRQAATRLLRLDPE